MGKLNFRKKAQSTAEYAILIGLIIAAAIALQTYAKRGIQGRVKDSTDGFVTAEDHTMDLEEVATGIDYSFTDWTGAQWEPEFLQSTVTSRTHPETSETETTEGEGSGKVKRDSTTARTRESEQTHDFSY